MKREFLKEMGLEQDQIDKILAENGKDIEGLKASNGIRPSKTDMLPPR